MEKKNSQGTQLDLNSKFIVSCPWLYRGVFVVVEVFGKIEKKWGSEGRQLSTGICILEAFTEVKASTKVAVFSGVGIKVEEKRSNTI